MAVKFFTCEVGIHLKKLVELLTVIRKLKIICIYKYNNIYIYTQTFPRRSLT